MCFQQQPDDESSVALMTALNHILNQQLPSGKTNQNLLYARTAILAEAVRMSQFLDSKALLSVALSKVRFNCWPCGSPCLLFCSLSC